MKLKKLSICGFKSFADRIAIDFECEIIGIVGPNGCGKSNIVDAFRWVMGEQSARSLRGDKMHDVLFAGTDQRKPLNYAEVSVWLSEVNGELPLPYSEVMITRRLHRDGDSEYFINKEPARLKDVQTLFLGSGIGKNAFSIFEQGKLDLIIHLAPLERRVMFDEAAGTSRFLQRKKETVRKLSAVTENYIRLRDIHAEIDKQVKQLKKQANQAESYQQNKQKLEALEKQVLLDKWKSLEEQNKESERKWLQLNQEYEEKKNQLHQQESALGEAKNRVIALEAVCKEAQAELNGSEIKVKVLEAEMEQEKHRLGENRKREEKVKVHLAEFFKEKQRFIGEKTQKIEALAFAAEKKTDHAHTLSAQKKIYEEIDKKFLTEQEKLKKIQAERVKLIQEEAKIQSLIQEKSFRFEARQARLQILNALQDTHLGTEVALCTQIEEKKAKLEGLTLEIDGYKEEVKKKETELQSLRQILSEVQHERQVMIRKMTETESQQKALMGLQEEMEGFSQSAKILLKEAKQSKNPLAGKIEPLFTYLSPFKGFEGILAAAMKTYAETLVVQSEEDLKRLVEVAKKKKLTGFSVIVKDLLPHKGSEVKKGSLACYLEKSPFADHFTQNYQLAEEGHFYDPLGVFFHVGSEKKLSNPFQRQAELKSLAESLSQMQQEEETLLFKEKRLLEDLKESEKERMEKGDIHRKKEMNLIQENFSLQQALKDFERLKREVASVVREKQEIESLHDEKNEIDAFQKKGQQYKSDLFKLVEQIHQQEIWIEAEKKNLKSHAQQLKDAERLYYETNHQWQNLGQAIQNLETKIEQHTAHEKKMFDEMEELQAEVLSIFEKLKNQEKLLEDLKNSQKRYQLRLQSDEMALLTAKKSMEEIEREVSKEKKAFAFFDKEKHGQEILLEQVTSEKKAVEIELQDRYGFSPETLIRTHIDLYPNNMEEAMKEIRRLRLSIESSGAVNMTAIEDFQQTQERFNDLDQQLKDLEDSKNDLEKMIQALDQESRKAFKKIFAQIRENFQKNFSLLFQGGSADLTFTESSDILEAGVEIVAKPPGKQMRSISLLSGGEKCLTALALLFSIFEVRPAPFCILDEVDAPLDDSNIERFTQVLKQFVNRTQFIIVTHNKKSMAIADLLIGVSMEEKGVSKLISLAFEQPKRAIALL